MSTSASISRSLRALFLRAARACAGLYPSVVVAAAAIFRINGSGSVSKTVRRTRGWRRGKTIAALKPEALPGCSPIAHASAGSARSSTPKKSLARAIA